MSGAGRAAAVKRGSHSPKASSQGLALNPAAIKEVSAGEYAVRFAFGAAISLVSGVVGIKFGPRAGGLFLAFPAILPAALTLLEKDEGEGASEAEAAGGVLGALGLLTFAALVALATRQLGAPVTLAVALGAWIVVAAGLYLVLRATWPRVWR